MKISKILIASLAILTLGLGNIANADAPAKTDDATITNTVKQKFQGDKSLSMIVIETKNGVVILTGDLKSDTDAHKAIEKAQSVPGVSDVDTEKLTVKGSKESEHPFKDAYITAKVKGIFLRDKLFGDKPISVSTIHVETKEGVVHLSGTVINAGIAKSAVDLAKTVKGVASVESNIKVKANGNHKKQ